jgi:hypothetical protein
MQTASSPEATVGLKKGLALQDRPLFLVCDFGILWRIGSWFKDEQEFKPSPNRLEYT